MLSWIRYPDFSLPILTKSFILLIQPFFLSRVHAGFTNPAGSMQGPTWPASLGSAGLIDAALSATMSVVAASLPPVEQHIAAEYTEYPETSQLLSIIVRLHVVSSTAILAWFNFYQSSCGMWVWQWDYKWPRMERSPRLYKYISRIIISEIFSYLKHLIRLHILGTCRDILYFAEKKSTTIFLHVSE